MNIYNLAFLLLFHLSFVFEEAPEFPPASAPSENKPEQTMDGDKAAAANIIFKSADGGQTWQDISEGLPQNLPPDGLERDGFFANDAGLYLRTVNGIYHSKPNSPAPFWKKEMFSDKQGSIAPGRGGLFAYNYAGQFLQQINGTSAWWPRYTDSQQNQVSTVLETAGGTIFIGSHNGLFKSANNGKNWKQVQTGSWVTKLAESEGVLLATSQEGILRSADDGESWYSVINEGGVGIAVERINGGFAAISFNTSTQSRRIHISLDNGKTWKAIDEGLQPSLYISSIQQMGKYLICGHPDGIFRTSDMGKTWKLILPSIKNKVFNLSVSGNVIYAIPRSRGC